VADYRATIVGGGWAGLTTAVTLANAGIKVTLIESSPQLGGRARTVTHEGMPSDNGQHLLVGAYTETLALIQRLGGDPATLFHRLPLTWQMRDPKGVQLDLRDHGGRSGLLGGLIKAKGLRLTEKLSLTRGLSALRSANATRPEETVSALLQRLGQSRKLCTLFWEPLCLAALNTHARDASATLFGRVARDALFTPGGSDYLIPAPGLSDALPNLALHALEQAEADVSYGDRVVEIAADSGGCSAITKSGKCVHNNALVLALPWHGAARLLQPVASRCAQALAQLEASPITTVYLRYSQPPGLEVPLTGLVHPVVQWLVEHRLDDGNWLLAAVISGSGQHQTWERSALEQRVLAIVADHFVTAQSPISVWSLREANATFLASPASDKVRPPTAVGPAGLFLAGDYTDTGYPATLEGAVRSGLAAAAAVLDDAGQTH
jgi:squalene-associated FAD-dependent desaturase